MTRLPLAPLALALLFLATDARAQNCPTGLTYEGQAALCVHLDASCEDAPAAMAGSLSLKGETCLPHAWFQPEARCSSTGVSAGGPCLVWIDEDAPEAASARAIVERYASGDNPAGSSDPDPAPPILTDVADLPDGFGDLRPALTPDCMDGRDNDGDGSTDYPENGCTSPFDHEETPEAGEGEAFHPFERPEIDPALQLANLQYCQENQAQVTADKRAILDYWHRQALGHGLTPAYDYLGTATSALDSALVRLGGSKREFAFSDRHPVDREWNDQVDFAFGWGRGQSMEINITCNVGISDIRSWGGALARGTGGGGPRGAKAWGPFDPEESRMLVADPDVRVSEFNRLRSSYLDWFRPSPVFYRNAEVAYLTPDRHLVVLVTTSADSGGNAARMNGSEGWRMVNASVSIGPWNLCTAGELTQPAATLTCENNQGRAQISAPPPRSPYVK